MKLLSDIQQGNFRSFVMGGELDTYYLTIITPPANYNAHWYNDYTYIVINDNYKTNDRSSWYCTTVSLHYFGGEEYEQDYMPKKLGIKPANYRDFMNCVEEYIFPTF